MSNIYSLQLEKHVLGGLINHPDVFPEVDKFLSESDFFSEVHYTIFCVLRKSLLKNEKADKVILADQLKNWGIKYNGDLDIYEYIDGIAFTQIKRSAVIQSVKDLKKYSLRRDYEKIGEELKESMRKNGDKECSQIIESADKICNKLVDSYTESEEPVKLTEGLLDLLEDRGNNPVKEIGLATPFKSLNRLYGGLRIGQAFAIASRPKQGKSTFLNEVAFGVAKINNCKVLFLDTEMATEEVKFRRSAALTDINPWWLESGNWRKNEEMVKKVRGCEALKEGHDIFHIYVGNMSSDKVCSLIRRFKYEHVGRGNPFLVVYDYLKITSENLSDFNKEYQAIGDKISLLKSCCMETEAALLTANQLNRTAENRGRRGSQVVDDMSTLAGSDRLAWFGGNIFIFRSKTADEQHLDNRTGVDFGTHKLICVASRYQGRDAAGFRDMVTRTLEDGSQRAEPNYLNFNIRNFKVEEKGTLEDIVRREDGVADVSDISEDDGDFLLE
jgi:replicative DNA helicase